ncbi:MAG: protein translocase subunit SecF, partial [Gammaproteobacteria bacterium]
RVEYVGPQVGKELVEDGGLAILFALGAIVVYIWLRFERRFALGALAATLHDPIVTLGYFSLFGTEFDMPTLAAILAVIGYSVNDTIVVFDRIRDNSRKMRKAPPIGVVNISINQTLSRTINTSGTTLLVIIALFVFGGPLLNGFSLALLIGIIVGTYSSVYVASAAALDLGLSGADLLTVDKDSVEHDHRP